MQETTKEIFCRGCVQTNVLHSVNRVGQFHLTRFEDDHVLVYCLEKGISEAGIAIQKTSLEHVEQEELDYRAARQAIKELLLMKALFVKVFFDERFQGLKGGVLAPVVNNLKRLHRAVRVVTFQPVRYTLAEREVIEEATYVANRAVRYGDRIHQTFVTYVLRLKQAHIKR